MTYKQYIKEQCELYAKKDTTRFIGYNTVYGSRMYGTLSDVPVNRCIESPVAENLMCGMAVGLCLEGFSPVVCFERHDFLLLGLDALVNHIDKLPEISGQQFQLPIIIRAIVGGKKKLDPGPMHRQNHMMSIINLLDNTKVVCPFTPQEIKDAWAFKGILKNRKPADHRNSGALIIVEYKDWYDIELVDDVTKNVENMLAP